MDLDNKEKTIEIIRREIELEDDMLDLYSNLLKGSDLISSLSENDRNLAEEILNMLLRDTARHKQTMQKLISSL